ncbi:MAG: preprotein translocase subunit SecE [Lentisphaerae bacterium GWF2_45_14]|nr:MAG: preprotein translocase subunit SecE [Lentisphaerae bacterium GWF2_45_14]
MNRLIGGTKQYVAETIAEMRKCSWPDRKELFESTILVTVAVVVMGSFIALIDVLSRLFIHYITKI